ncbi:hypothetical protein C481_07296 [Natrialba asiatica DSM 12278]|uniref:Uncharacterized protein n=1 Tax=Natrialba asiatica (strain ATCC 700177 / DSM 12278 / JCM 9576 / FERM P-10747 / NBRC 102637 / 172P1) TaxID=29540 RepID=M0AUS5_NATA1|nr:hypothetical protein C481_07296 [Natrialba asiatica DSM 12278]
MTTASSSTIRTKVEDERDREKAAPTSNAPDRRACHWFEIRITAAGEFGVWLNADWWGRVRSRRRIRRLLRGRTGELP